MDSQVFPPQTTIGAAIPAGNNNIGDVDVASIAAGETHIGAVGGNSALSEAVVAMTNHAGYVANDFVGTDHVGLTFAACARVTGGTGVIQSAVLVDYALQSISTELWLFDTAPAGLGDDSAAFTITDADAARCIGVIPFTTYFADALNSVSPVQNVGIGFKTLAGSTALYGAIVTRGAPAYASNDLTVRLVILQD